MAVVGHVLMLRKGRRGKGGGSWNAERNDRSTLDMGKDVGIA